MMGLYEIHDVVFVALVIVCALGIAVGAVGSLVSL